MPKTPPPPSRFYFKEIRFRQLRAIVELSLRGSFTAAAAELKLSVPSVWQQVRALEQAFGTELVVNTGGQVEMTESGSLLVKMAMPLVEGFDSLQAVFADQNTKSARKLTVATTASLLAYELGEPMKRYRQEQPGVQMTFLDRPSMAARTLLEAGEADLAVVGELDDAEPLALFESERLTSYPFMLVCPADHPVAAKKKLTLQELARHPLVLPGEGTNSRLRVENRFLRAGLLDDLQIVLGASNSNLLMRYVTMGFGIAILSISPQAMAEQVHGAAGSELLFRDLKGLFGEEHIVMLHRRGRHLRPHEVAFRQVLHDLLGHPANPAV